MHDNGVPHQLEVTCPRCQCHMMLTQDEIVVFYTNFFCLKCGQKTGLPVSPEVYAKLKAQNDRERRLPGPGAHGQETLKHVR